MKHPMDDLRIAPRKEGRDWTVGDYKALNFDTEQGWQTAIQIFEDRIRGRFLNHVEKIERNTYAGFAVMALDCLLIETLEQFRQGVAETPGGDTKQYFINFLTRPPFSKYFVGDRKAELFYKHIRCGILHQAEIKGSSRIRIDTSDLVRNTDDGKGLIINRQLFHQTLVQAFEEYLEELRKGDDRELRRRFKAKMDAICKISGQDE